MLASIYITKSGDQALSEKRKTVTRRSGRVLTFMSNTMILNIIYIIILA